VSQGRTELDRKLARGTAWVGVVGGLSGVLDLGTTVACLWLWVTKEELGIATIASALFPILDRVAQLGLNQAAVRRAEAGRAALSSIFWTSLAISLAQLALLAAFALVLGRQLEHPVIAWLLVAYGGKLVVQNASLVPEARLRHALAFGQLSKVRAISTLTDNASKVLAAYLGAHYFPDLRVGCFVIGPIMGGLVVAVGLQLIQPWRPQWTFDTREVREAVRFGIHLSVADLLYFAYTNCDYLVVGVAFDAAAVGAYRLAYEMVLDIVRLVSMVTAEVVFPAFTRLADQRALAAEHLLKFTRQNLMMVAPLLVAIGVAADDLLGILYPPLGPAAGTAVRILCIVGALRSASFVIPPMLAGLGHSRDAVVYNLVAAIVCPAAFAIAAATWRSGGYLAVAWAWALGYPIAFAVLVYLALNRTGTRLRSYARVVAPIALWAGAMTAVALAVHAALPESRWLRAGGVAGVALLGYVTVLVPARTRAVLGLPSIRGAKS
jgi:O-antigen/teichoic acid export membrane protein